ncbi:hypothetical protein RF11_04420 [Thelohanellus kitauei]|uniref:Uncharacterized protein n=1 Tax=Thelohanellus kitauei TaxID=669202 RepID=A0A0C2M1C9_THEKT|nr:hypothetical protein RF11_04420 [Thelohanellus kitauei]
MKALKLCSKDLQKQTLLYNQLRDCPIVNSNGQKIEPIVDTEDEKSVIFDKLFKNDRIFSSTYIFLSATHGSKINVTGEVSLFVGPRKRPCMFLVVCWLSVDATITYDSLEHSGQNSIHQKKI